MQTRPDELKAQQIVLAYLGFYKGVIDGIWSDTTIKAKQAFECDDKFLPAAPTMGLPFGVGSRLPKGLMWEKGYLTHRELTLEKSKAILDKHSKPTAKPTMTVTKVVEKPVEQEPEKDVKNAS